MTSTTQTGQTSRSAIESMTAALRDVETAVALLVGALEHYVPETETALTASRDEWQRLAHEYRDERDDCQKTLNLHHRARLLDDLGVYPDAGSHPPHWHIELPPLASDSETVIMVVPEGDAPLVREAALARSHQITSDSTLNGRTQLVLAPVCSVEGGS